MAIAVGKAAVPMMAAAQARSIRPLHGLVVAPHGHVPEGSGWPGVTILTAGHPVPDAASLAAAEAALALAAGLGAGDHLLALVSGGGSALLAAPVAGVSLADKAAVTQALLRSGAGIAEINAVRKALSRIKGGGLAASAAPAAVTTWVISDIPGDDASLVASGPTIAGSGISAREVIKKYGLTVPPGVATALTHNQGLGPPAPAASGTLIIASPRDALEAMTRQAVMGGYAVSNLGDALEGEARVLGAAHAVLARRLSAGGGRHAIISGGETRVTVIGLTGRGGRNLEYALALAIGLAGEVRIAALAADSDGIDGSSDAAGAVVTPDTLAWARRLGLEPAAFLAANDAHGFFERLGDLVVTGPTLTNVNDLRVILIG